MTLSKTLQKVVIAMLQRSVRGEDGSARRLETNWDKGRTSFKAKDRIQVTEKDGKKLVEAGLVFYQDNGHIGYELTAEGVAWALPQVKYKTLDVRACLDSALDYAYFHPDDRTDGEVAIPAIYQPGTSKLVLVLGENAGGKSFFRRLLRGVTHPGRKARMGEPAIKPGSFPVREFIHLSMQGRTDGGFMTRMVYGTEERQSTGENSAHIITKGIETAKGRTHPNVIYWDEPDIGMSAGAAMGAGMALAKFLQEESPLVQAVCITSHSAALLRPLGALDPHYVYLGNADGPATLDAWFKAQENPVPVSPKELQDRSRARFLLIRKILNSKD